MTTWYSVLIAISALTIITGPVFAASPTAQDQQQRHPVWNVLHGYNYSNYSSEEGMNVVTLPQLKRIVKEDGVNAVEIDIIYHTDRFYTAHDYDVCETNAPRRAELCLDLEPLLQEIEANPNITFVWIDPKDEGRWVESVTEETIYFSHLATYVRQHIKSKPIWWGLSDVYSGELEELVSIDPLGPLEGVSFDYGKFSLHFDTVQDIYLRARKAGVANIAYSNEPGYALHSCDELNKAVAYRAEGKLSRVFSWTINDEPILKELYQSGGSVVNCITDDLDEAQLVGPVDGIISDMYQGVRTQHKVIEGDPTLRLANRSDVLWPPAGNTVVEDHKTDNVLANGGAEMPPLPGQLASSWRLGYTRANGALTLSQEDCPGITPHSGSRFFALPVCGQGAMYQDIVLDAYSDEIRKGDVEVSISASFLAKSLTSTSAELGVLFLDDGNFNAGETTFHPSLTASAATEWIGAGGTVRVPTNARVARLFVAASANDKTKCGAGNASSMMCSAENYLFIDNLFLAVYEEKQKKFSLVFIVVIVLSVAIAAVVLAIIVFYLKSRSTRREEDVPDDENPRFDSQQSSSMAPQLAEKEPIQVPQPHHAVVEASECFVEKEASENTSGCE